ncbi:amidohydrolase family protein [Mycolicibacterium thermoresistibile]
MIIVDAALRGRAGTWDIHIDDGTFTSIVPHASGAGGAAGAPDTFDAAGRLVVEPFVDAHVHLDYANTAGRPRINESGNLFEAIDIWAERKAQGLNNFDEIYGNALAAARSEAAHGTGFIRSHVDITDPELTALQALLQLREDVKDWIEIQLVAFPQNSLLSFPDGPGLLDRALELGADAVGGIPHLEATREDGTASLRLVFDLAEKYGVPVDVHCDEIDDPQSRFVEVMAALASRSGLELPVTASHAVAMAYYPESYLAKLSPQLVAAQLNFAVCPNENLQLQGRGMMPVPRGVAPIKRLTESGLNVAFGQDSIGDPFYPLGEGNMLRILDIGLHVGHMLSGSHLADALRFITDNGARNLGLADRYGIEVGKPAHCIVLDCHSDLEAVRHQPDVLCNVHNGATVFTRQPASYTTTMPGFSAR